jgi:hypothetical protein
MKEVIIFFKFIYFYHIIIDNYCKFGANCQFAHSLKDIRSTYEISNLNSMATAMNLELNNDYYKEMMRNRNQQILQNYNQQQMYQNYNYNYNNNQVPYNYNTNQLPYNYNLQQNIYNVNYQQKQNQLKNLVSASEYITDPNLGLGLVEKLNDKIHHHNINNNLNLNYQNLNMQYLNNYNYQHPVYPINPLANHIPNIIPIQNPNNIYIQHNNSNIQISTNIPENKVINIDEKIIEKNENEKEKEKEPLIETEEIKEKEKENQEIKEKEDLIIEEKDVENSSLKYLNTNEEKEKNSNIENNLKKKSIKSRVKGKKQMKKSEAKMKKSNRKMKRKYKNSLKLKKN